MTVKVFIPNPLRADCDQQATVEVAGATVGACLAELVARHPPMKATLFDDDGGLRPFINLYLGDRDIRDRNGLDTRVDEGAELMIVPGLAGGSAASFASPVADAQPTSS